MMPKRFAHWLMRIEGGKVNDPLDRGGKTNMGITAGTANRAYQEGIIPSPDPYDLTLEQALDVYHRYYYLPAQCQMMRWPMDLVHFDAAVNHGVGGAGKLLQRAINVLNQYTVQVDGVVGPRTIRAYLEAQATHGEAEIARVYLLRRTEYYYGIARRSPSQKRFLRGWLNRIHMLEKEIVKG